MESQTSILLHDTALNKSVDIVERKRIWPTNYNIMEDVKMLMTKVPHLDAK